MDMKFVIPIANLCFISIFVSNHWPFPQGNCSASLTNFAPFEIDFGQCGNKEENTILVSVQPKHKLCQSCSDWDAIKATSRGQDRKKKKKISQTMSVS